ncbi:MAG TPA: FAD-binding protein [Anaerolineae bacterium]|nr:FAD-binding protein [Anaerolineae bacterium]
MAEEKSARSPESSGQFMKEDRMGEEKEVPRKLSRKEFVKGAAVVAGAGALASCAPAATPVPTTAPEATAVPTPTTAPAPAPTSVPTGEAPREFTTFDTDVLVIGAGVGGVEAAIAAVSSGANVILVEKRKLGRCGNSGIKSSAQFVSGGLGFDDDTPEKHLADCVENGLWMVDQKLGLAVCQASVNVALRSENYGNVHVRSLETGEPAIISGGPSGIRRRWQGYKLTNHTREALKLGCKVLEYCMVTNLLTDDEGAVIGATAVDFHTGEFYVIRAKATVLATGGDNQLWKAGTLAALHAYGVLGLTGDGHAMAAPLGVEFRDLEFRATSQGLVGVPALRGWSYGAAAGADSTDKNGVKFMADIPKEELTPRRIRYEVEKMVAEGRGGPNGGWFGAPGVHAADYDGMGYIRGEASWKLKWQNINGLDMSNQELYWNHGYNYGGIVGNENAETGVPGLYAAGECSMHCGAGYGSFRMFTSGLVTGRWSGENGAARARTIETPSIDWSKVAKEYNRVFGALYAEPANPLRVHEVRHKVQDAAWMGSGAILRSEKKSRNALDVLDSVEKDDLPRMYIADKSKVCNMEWMEALETINMITMARLDTLASVTRTESRGTHLRNEYPDMDNDTWLKNVYIKMVDGEIKAETKPVIITSVTPPSGKFPQGGGTLPE